MYAKRHYGLGDPNFAAISAYFEDGGRRVAAVEIPNADRSGSQFFLPDARLLAVLQSMERAQQSGEVRKGTFAQMLANGLDAAPQGGSRFYIEATSPALSTGDRAGANNAVGAAQAELARRGLVLGEHDELVRMIREQQRGARHTGQDRRQTMAESRLPATRNGGPQRQAPSDSQPGRSQQRALAPISS